MGTRADFYVGRGQTAEWLGSIAWDGYPEGHPKPLLAIKTEQEFREKVAEILGGERGGATLPEQGWPWPWENSNTTDFAYAFDDGQVWGTCFGHGWWPADIGDQSDEGEEHPKISDWPDMTALKNNPPMGSHRSGVMVLSMSR